MNKTWEKKWGNKLSTIEIYPVSHARYRYYKWRIRDNYGNILCVNKGRVSKKIDVFHEVGNLIGDIKGRKFRVLDKT